MLAHSINALVTKPSWRNMRNMFLQLQITFREGVYSLIVSTATSVCLNSEAWLFRIYKDYIAMMVHFIDNTWRMHNCLLKSVRSKTPYTEEASLGPLFDIINT